MSVKLTFEAVDRATREMQEIRSRLKRETDGVASDSDRASKNTQASWKKVNSTLDSLGLSWKRLGGIIGGAFSIYAIKNFTEAVISSFAEQEAAEKKLEVAIGRRSQALLDAASAMQEVTAFSDEMIIAAMASVGAFIDDEQAIRRATEAALDLAAAKGMDLTQAADLLAKSIGSETNALSRYGITVEGAAGSTQRLEMAIDGVARLYGGQAAAQLDTFEGQWANLKNQLDEVYESLGGAIVPVLMTDVLPAIRGVVEQTTAWVGANQELIAQDVAGFIERTGDAIQFLDKTFFYLSGQFVTTNENFREFLDNIGLLEKIPEDILDQVLPVGMAFDWSDETKRSEAGLRSLYDLIYTAEEKRAHQKAESGEQETQTIESLEEIYERLEEEYRLHEETLDLMYDALDLRRGHVQEVKEITRSTNILIDKTKKVTSEEVKRLGVERTLTSELDEQLLRLAREKILIHNVSENFNEWTGHLFSINASSHTFVGKLQSAVSAAYDIYHTLMLIKETMELINSIGNLFGGLFGLFFHQGGVIGGQQISSWAPAGTPRKQIGGMMSGTPLGPRERLIVGEEGESVLTRDATRRMGGPRGIAAINAGAVPVEVIERTKIVFAPTISLIGTEEFVDRELLPVLKKFSRELGKEVWASQAVRAQRLGS